MIMDLFRRLFPINRSITGDGVRETLTILNEIVPIEQKEYPTGIKCFDWTVPKEWNVKDAYIKDSKGTIIVDFKTNNLHLVGYSVPIKGIFSKEELMQRIHSLPDQPDAIPYVTSYYKETWGFCIEHQRLNEFADDYFEVLIDVTLEEGHLTIGEAYIQGETEEEILFSSYVCHPSMAINELSGPLVQTFIYKYLLEKGRLKYSYRFLFIPETIGSILYLSLHGEHLKDHTAAGYVVTCVGHGESFNYKKSRRGNTLADKAAIHVLRQSGKTFKVRDWYPYGSDERQYCSQAFNLPVGSLTRTMYLEYDEYHTSLDNEDLISETVLLETIHTYTQVIDTLEANEIYCSTHTYCEPNLDKRGLPPVLGVTNSANERISTIMYLLAFCDGEHDLIDIAEKLNIPATDLKDEALVLLEKGLLQRRES